MYKSILTGLCAGMFLAGCSEDTPKPQTMEERVTKGEVFDVDYYKANEEIREEVLAFCRNRPDLFENGNCTNVEWAANDLRMEEFKRQSTGN